MHGILKNTILCANVKLLQTSHTFYITKTTFFFQFMRKQLSELTKYRVVYPEFSSCTILYEQVFQRRE